jgi:DNA-binding Lrp family transcriptional regulator
MIDPILEELQRNSRTTPEELAKLFHQDAGAIAAKIQAWEADGTILGYHAVVDPESAGHTGVTAFIEVKMTPERDGGFDRVARRISKFSQVTSCYLMSGGYDLGVVVEDTDLRAVASFIAEKLSTLDGVISTATHFQLKVYKQSRFTVQGETQPGRLPVVP